MTSTTGNEAKWQDLLPQVLGHVQSGKYGKVVGLTSKVLGQGSNSGGVDNGTSVSVSVPIPQDVLSTMERIHCRALLQTGKFQQVVDYSSSSSSSSSSGLILEKAYALYRLGRYISCRDCILQHRAAQSNDGTNNEMEVGLLHILAQCHYRLAQTKEASEVYNVLLQRKSEMGMEEDEEEELLTNALAATSLSNHTFAARTSSSSSSTLVSMEDALRSKLSLDEEEKTSSEEYPYELAYNYATQLLLSSTSQAQTRQALDILTRAEDACRSVYGGDVPLDEEKDEKQSEETKEQRIQMHQDLTPIQANKALASMLLGDTNGAARTYLTLLAGSKSLPKSSLPLTVRMAADNNLTVLASRKSGSGGSVFDLLKKLPDPSSSSSSCEASPSESTHSHAHAHAASLDNRPSSTSPSLPARATPNQVRTLLLNRAVVLLRMNRVDECRTVLGKLRTSIRSVDDLVQEVVDQTTKTTPTSANQRRPKNKNRRKHKGASGPNAKGDSSSNNTTGTTLVQHAEEEAFLSLNSGIPPAPPANEAERILWSSRIAILESELDQGDTTTPQNGDDVLTQAMKHVRSKLEQTIEESAKETLECALAEMTLYQLQKQNPPQNRIGETTTTQTLETLPTTIRSRPATIATLAAIYHKQHQHDQIETTLQSASGMDASSTQSLADFKSKLGMHREAAALYASVLETVTTEREVWECTAGLVKALSYCDPDQAAQRVLELPEFEEEEGEGLDGEELEAMHIPRLGKGSSSASGSIGGSSRVRNALERQRRGDESQKKKKKNHETILRKRQKKRETYLQKLQSEGRYNPARPTKPDPERWIPKNQRSYAKRGRKGRHKFVGAQGGGTGVGADKEAAKLDVAARKAAREEAGDASGAGGGFHKPSTAHLAVSSNGPVGKSGRRR